MRTPKVHVTVNLDAVRANAEAIRARAGVGVIAVIKADAYGLGAPRIADALAGIVDEFAYFSAIEARELGRPGLVLGPCDEDAATYRELRLRPAIATLADAERMGDLPVAIKVDTGMQRFGCPPDQLAELAAHCNVQDFFSHAVTQSACARLQAACADFDKPLHAAATALLDDPDAWLDAVRPGLALYRGATRVSTRLRIVRETHGPVGYTGFEQSPVGVILVGYSNLLAPGPVLINGRRQRIIEVGMNTSFVTVDPEDHVGDEVVLLGDGLTETEIATHLKIRPHEVLCRYCATGPRQYVKAGPAASADAPDTTQSSVPVPQQT